MTEEKVQPEEMINNPEVKNDVLFADPEENNININSGTEQTQTTNVTIESEILNNTLRFMVLRGKAWPSTHQAFIHLSMLFMNPTWYSENDLATKINDNFREAPFTVDQTKKALRNLSNLQVLETKQVKGKTKYKLSTLGNALITRDNILMEFLGFRKDEQTQPEQSNATAAAELEATTGAATPEPVLDDDDPKGGDYKADNTTNSESPSTN